mmetsp:Transcript_51702/g.147393  ORF Transcript_51702/g.147393 Transcript_51702/m.147393 type:complete len:103 (+) Transcript_51702:125-433(+)
MGCLSSSAAGAAAGSKYAAEAGTKPSNAPGAGEPPLSADPVVAAVEELPARREEGRSIPVEQAGLWRDDDGDEAHEFWEEDPSGNLRPVAAADLNRVGARGR